MSAQAFSHCSPVLTTSTSSTSIKCTKTTSSKHCTCVQPSAAGFAKCAENGHLHVLQWLTEQYPVAAASSRRWSLHGVKKHESLILQVQALQATT
eukprot:10844-Heterococcus_DN1.PRE.1